MPICMTDHHSRSYLSDSVLSHSRVVEWALNADNLQPKSLNYYENPEMEGKSSGDVFDMVVSQCAARGILVLLDMHRLASTDGISELWYSEAFTESKVALCAESCALVADQGRCKNESSCGFLLCCSFSKLDYVSAA